MPRYRKTSTRCVAQAGKYEVLVVSAKNQRSKAGNQMITLGLSLSEGGAPGLVFDHLVFTESCCWKIADFLTAMGETLSDEMDIEPSNYVGRTAFARVGIEDFNGHTQNKIEKWLPPESKAAKATHRASPTQPTSVPGGSGA
jgi:Protein of unknown function (DUF669)